GGQQLLRADRETTAPIGAATADEIVAAVGAALARADVLVLSDYAKGVLTDDVLARLIGAAAGKPVVVDPKARDLRRYAGATVLTPNRAELAASVGRALDDDAAIAEAARDALNAASAGALLVTRGSDGMTLVTRAGAVERLPTAAREVYDVAGAGDTVTAVLGAALGAGLPLATAARLANIAAGIVVGKRGTAVVHPDELAHALRERALLDVESKVVGLATAQGIVEAWRRDGQRVAFTNGCFDLLHPGHISLLNQAKAAGDRLVVGLNGDAGVTRLKGPGRPVQSDVARAQVLASLAVVDLVVVFEEDTPTRLIEALRPEVLVKGADYRLDQVVGGDLVARWGGRVVLVDLTPGYSTTETIKRLGR
ncbi:MAG: D-glycero-beta-D-manno-heptose 1-phosphate adenylyltransferase, partial [Alphaproteobacteria bacterium]